MKKLLLSVLPAITFILFSCTSSYYPGEVNTPGFTDKNQVKGGISYGTSGTNFQLGYSPLKNIGVIGSISYLNVKGSEPQFQRNWEFGLGYFNRLHKKEKIYYEIFAGFDISETRSAFKDDLIAPNGYFENSKYYRIFVQPDFTFSYEFIDVIFTNKMSYFNFTFYENDAAPNHELPKAIGFEPAFTFKAGGENIKFKTQFGFTYIFKTSGSEFNYKKGFIFFGLAFAF